MTETETAGRQSLFVRSADSVGAEISRGIRVRRQGRDERVEDITLEHDEGWAMREIGREIDLES